MKLIVLDPGHGGDADSKRGFYGTGEDRNEGINNFKTCVAIKKYIEERYLADVKMTRSSVEDYPWPGRGDMFPGADLFYSRHSNSFNGAVRGSEVLVGTGSPAASLLAFAICSKTAELFGHNNRGLLNGNTFVVIGEAKAAGAKMAMLAEIGFHDAKLDADFMIASRNLIAAWEGELIARHLKLETIPKETVLSSGVETTQTTRRDAPKGYIFTVRVGSGKLRSTIEQTKAKAIQAGFEDAYIELVPFSKEA